MSKASAQQLRRSLQAVCLSLRALGVPELTPEVLIQAKSGGPVVKLGSASYFAQNNVRKNALSLQADALGRALHDLVVLKLAGWPAADSSLLRQYWVQLDCEGEEAGLPKQGCCHKR